MRAKRVVLATGAHERPLVFPDNDRPGIMLADAARGFATRYGVKPGARAVVATAHDSAYRAALELADAGVEIAMIADLRADAPRANGRRRRAARGLRVETGATIVGARGRLRVTHALVAQRWVGRPAGQADADRLRPHRHERRLDAERRICSRNRAASSPSTRRRRASCPACSAQAERSAGACRGVFALAEALADGAAAGAAAVGAPAPRRSRVEGAPAAGAASSGLVAGAWRPAKSKAFVDFQNDVTARDIELATREGMRSIEHIKRYTTTGMATDQGKTSNMNALAIAAEALGKTIPKSASPPSACPIRR